jgi:hypothetical protein
VNSVGIAGGNRLVVELVDEGGGSGELRAREKWWEWVDGVASDYVVGDGEKGERAHGAQIFRANRSK